MACENIFKGQDLWVVSHLILPYSLTILGYTTPQITLLLVYMWESIEMSIRSCSDGSSNWAAHESQTNALISDPLMGVCGILVAILLKQSFGIIYEIPKNYIRRILYFLLNLSPTFLFYDVFLDNNLHNLFPFMVILILHFTTSRNLDFFEIISYLYILILHFSISLSNDWSLLIAFLISFVFIFVLVLYNYNRDYFYNFGEYFKT